MTRVVLLAVNAKYVHSSLSVWSLASGVKQYAARPYDIKVMETARKQPDDQFMGLLTDFAPDVVGISVYIWNADKIPAIMRQCKERLPDTVLVLGGPEASHNAAYWLKSGADYVLCGEGERSFPLFLDMLEGGARPEDIPGLCRHTREGICAHAGAVASGLWPDPYDSAYEEALRGRIAYIETARGCPFQCAFCLSGGSGVRFLPLDEAKKRIDKLAKLGAATLKFVDRTFNCHAGRAYALFAHVIGMETSCCFHFEVAADLFDEQTLALLAEAPPGRIQLEAGLQSFYPPALQASSRQTDLEKAEKNIRALLNGGNIHVHVDLIAGLPYETLPDFAESFNRAYALGAHTCQLGFLKLLHGSVLRRQAARLGIQYDPEPPYMITQSPWLRAEDLAILQQAENALQHTYNKGRFLRTMRYVLTASGMTPFALYRKLGEAAPHHGLPLDVYAGQIYAACVQIAGVDEEKLREAMICDWLELVKGRNMPPFLKIQDRRRVLLHEIAKKQLGYKPGREETAVLPSGMGVFVDKRTRNPVTGLYPLHMAALL